jgi:hypothetical protein
MPGQAGALAKCRATVVASEGAALLVHGQHMCLQEALASKLLRAPVARKRPAPLVHHAHVAVAV